MRTFDSPGRLTFWIGYLALAVGSAGSAGCGGKGAAVGGPGVSQARCGSNAVIDAGGACTTCPAGHGPSGSRCLPGLERVPGPGGERIIAALDADWHPDPDDDGVVSSKDRCPHVHDPGQEDRDRDGLGDACDPDASAPLALRIEHVTPYGAWMSVSAPPPGGSWRGAVVWSREADSLASEAGVAKALQDGDAWRFNAASDPGAPHGPVIITTMEPGTRYHAVLAVLGYQAQGQGEVQDVGPVIELTTRPAPALDMSRAHPRLLIHGDGLATLRERREKGDSVWRELSEQMGELVTRAADPGRGVHRGRSYCAAAALLYQVTGDKKHRDAAAALLAQNIEHVEKTQLVGGAYLDEGSHIALCLDLLGDEVDTPTRARAVAAYLDDDERNLESAADLGDPRTFTAMADTLLLNSLLACGASDLPETLRDKGCAHLDIAKRRWFGVQLVRARRQRGAHAQSGGYLPAGLVRGQIGAALWVRSLLALGNAGAGLAEYRGFLRNLLAVHWSYSLVPGGRGHAAVGQVGGFARMPRDAALGDEITWVGAPNTAPFDGPQIVSLALLAGALQRSNMDDEASWARWLMLRSRDRSADFRSGFTDGNLANLIHEYDGIKPRDPRSELPLGYLDRGAGLLSSRTSWRDDASFLLVRAGPNNVPNSHGDAGHFQLHRRGRWITHEALGGDGATASAQAHNVLALEIRQGQEPALGQQTGRAGAIRMIRASQDLVHTFAVADTTGAYRRPGRRGDPYRRVQRTILWLHDDESDGPETVLVHDRAEKVQDAEITLAPTLFFHFDEAPAITGRSAAVDLPGDPGQRAELHVLLPAAARLSALAPEGLPDRYPSAIYTHRVAVELPGDPPVVTALTALRAGDASGQAPAPRAAAAGDFLVAIAGRDVALFPARAIDPGPIHPGHRSANPGKPGTGAKPVTATIPGAPRGAVRVWWSGFAPGAALVVTAKRRGDGVELAASDRSEGTGEGLALRADDGGLLALSIDSSGAVTAVYRRGR